MSLEIFKSISLIGGFSYADTLGSAKGWAASIMYNKQLAPQFVHFKNRSDTFSLGVCNGCQLMSLIGWIGVTNTEEIVSVPDIALLENRSERYQHQTLQSSVSILIFLTDTNVAGQQSKFKQVFFLENGISFILIMNGYSHNWHNESKKIKKQNFF